MKKLSLVLLLLIIIATTSACNNVTHIHYFQAATCTTPMKCIECGETYGEPLGHQSAVNSFDDVCCRCGDWSLNHEYKFQLPAVVLTGFKGYEYTNTVTELSIATNRRDNEFIIKYTVNIGDIAPGYAFGAFTLKISNSTGDKIFYVRVELEDIGYKNNSDTNVYTGILRLPALAPNGLRISPNDTYYVELIQQP